MSENSLKTGSILKGSTYSYKIDKVLGNGSFGITYLATTKVKISGPLGTFESTIPVAIKEFFMKDINGREDNSVSSGSDGGMFNKYKKKFIKEAQTLSSLNHNNIIKVLEAFEANNTYYYAMEYCEGGTLDSLISSKKGLSEEETITFTEQIADALSFMHNHKMLHLDLKPGNVMLNKKGDAILIDFGLSKQYDQNGDPESSTNIGGGTPGYAPIEQANYTGNEREFPVKMDIYALGATMYKMLTGIKPPEASIIINEGFPIEELESKNVSRKLIGCIQKAMSPLKKDRYSTIEEFILDLKSKTPQSEAEETIVRETLKGFGNETTKVRENEQKNTQSANNSYTATSKTNQDNYVNYQKAKTKTSFEYYNAIEEYEESSNKKTIILWSIIFIIIFFVAFLAFKFISPKSDYAKTYDFTGLDIYPMIKVEGGEFMMGSKDGFNTPIHKVRLNDFYIGQYEVSQGFWFEIMGTRPAASQPTHTFDKKRELTQEEKDKVVLENISYYDAIEFVEKLNKRTGNRFSLPTEAQWEYAARGGKENKDKKYAIKDGNPANSWSNRDASSIPYYIDYPSENSLGIYNMSGNVYEWCLDYYDKNYYTKSNTIDNPVNNTKSKYKVIRGGGYSTDHTYITVYERDYASLQEKSKNIGLRLVLNE